MAEKLAYRLTSFLCTHLYENEKDKARIQYGLIVLFSEGFKIIFLILFFNIIRAQNYFYFSLLILLSIRVFSGGAHIKGTLNCLLLTTVMFICTSALAPIMPGLPAPLYLLIGLACLLIVLARAPVRSTARPIRDNRIKQLYKLIAAVSTALWTIALLLSESTPYTNCGFSTLLLQNIQLVLVKRTDV